MVVAVDVAFTEAAVGAGVSVVFFLATLSLTSKYEYNAPTRLLPIIVVLMAGGALFYGTLDMPEYGDTSAPTHSHVSAKFIEAETQAFEAYHAQKEHDKHDGEKKRACMATRGTDPRRSVCRTSSLRFSQATVDMTLLAKPRLFLPL